MGCATVMRKRLVKHGNSRALVIDKAILELLNLGDDEEVIVSTDGRSLTITPVADIDARRARIDEALLRVDERYSTTLDRLAR
ncbi:AbrB/MazE/SpoVT family DNA-binding domain-containing protein [Anaerosoma tenue]|uniref:AbrB/MazE/SpoVT family DNA-binding domain-containing protein n=1 Tax=Anaerosoma tenue TaxID=2933588 RepID=UPI0022609F8E|nr:AbrB/MazE/SpoVT family DNA-binding domain-containing protein [Anaerosoma tenue]MCK8115490.1 AbrB/MazE/SpoVT family DNA-binding domain-containing protein [Anaerosoma tenue]